jgi:hypothetical protein
MNKLQKLRQQAEARKQYQQSRPHVSKKPMVPVRISGIYHSVFCKGEK